MILLLSTRNPGKIAEIRLLLSDLPIALRSVSEIDGAPFVEEDADTLEGNARKKAETLHAFGAFLLWLTIQAWKWMRSADCRRAVGPIAGLQADDAANRRKLLADLQAVRDRSARFRTVIALADETGTRFFEGVCRGTIIDEERGSKGFGYDRIFVPEGGNRTFAELDAEERTP